MKNAIKGFSASSTCVSPNAFGENVLTIHAGAKNAIELCKPKSSDVYSGILTSTSQSLCFVSNCDLFKLKK